MLAYVGKMGRAVARRRRQQAAIRELSALDDRMLADLGIRRSQIVNSATGQDNWRRN